MLGSLGRLVTQPCYCHGQMPGQQATAFLGLGKTAPADGEVGPVDRLPGHQLCHQAHTGKLGQSRQVLCCIEGSVDDESTGVAVKHTCGSWWVGLFHPAPRAELR